MPLRNIARPNDASPNFTLTQPYISLHSCTFTILCSTARYCTSAEHYRTLPCLNITLPYLAQLHHNISFSVLSSTLLNCAIASLVQALPQQRRSLRYTAITIRHLTMPHLTITTLHLTSNRITSPLLHFTMRYRD